MSEPMLRIDGTEYAFPLDDILSDLTGNETIMLEDYLGGWENFDPRTGATRSVIVCVWLAKHHAGEDVTLDEIQEMKGLVFGDAVEPVEVDASPPAEESPSSSAETSANGGVPLLEPSTT